MHSMSKPAVWEKYEKYYNMTSADKILPRVLSNLSLKVLFYSFTTTYRENGSANNVDPDVSLIASSLIRICIVCLSGFKFCQIFLSNNPFDIAFEWLSPVSDHYVIGSQTSCQESAVRKFMTVIN